MLIGMLIVIAVILFTVSLGLGFSITVLLIAGSKKARLGKDNASCFVGILLGVYLWVVLIASFLPQSTSLFLTLLGLFMVGATPIAALPALILYGAGKK